MRIPASVVGTTVGPREQSIDARWVMAYSAALGESAPEYLDTTRPEGILPHPLFPVCYEWPVALDARANALPDEVAVRGVHATHRLVLHRPPRVGDRLSTTATVAALERRAPGAYMVLRMETVDAGGRPVSTTDYGSLYLGVECDGPPHPALSPSAGEGVSPGERPSPLTLSPPGRGQGEGAENEGHEGERPSRAGQRWAWSADVPVAATLAHIYTECARIWNPIHTDRAVARAAGLPDIILHGTATLALAVSEVLRRRPGGPARPVRALHCRFGAMVRLPSRLVVRGDGGVPSAAGTVVRFEALAEDGRPAVRDAGVVLAP
ncbi:MAG TPA: MaoC/PaaZ C-terminal domain-containing protein [Methylomirabilota bacterium]|nr:MaoC/PaaZ C-terminal domain-containing protein [Methylomirabilota bacterium]